MWEKFKKNLKRNFKRTFCWHEWKEVPDDPRYVYCEKCCKIDP